jgi:hypothetical protein
MTDPIMIQLAKLQTQVRKLEDENKKFAKKLIARDDEIYELNKVIDNYKLGEKMIAKNKSYLELKAQKDIDQVKQNIKLKEGNTNETKTTNRRKK